MRRWFSQERLAEARVRAQGLQVGVDDVLIATRELSPDTYMYAQAATLGLAFADLDKVPREHCPLDDDGLFQAARSGLLPLDDGSGLRLVMAKRGLWLRALALNIDRRPQMAEKLILTSPALLRRFVTRHTMLAQRAVAADSLRDRAPQFSAALPENKVFAALTLGTVALAGALFWSPRVTANAVACAVSAFSLAWSMLRLALLRSAAPPLARAPAVLPTYTIVAALYGEAATVPKLVAALDALDYPPEKLQVILALESDDYATRDAVAALRLPSRYEVVLAPMPPPRGKPKALNAALPFVRGDFVVVYDAEDRPESNQLREAAAIFAADTAGEIACVQARLTIDNSDDSWLTHAFTAEYAGHFDVILPAMAHRQLPIPLGGSSTHLRTEIVRAVGAWDPYNVTEDADLGIRLARFGFRSVVATSSTPEEAPAEPLRWLRQRTRWFKGWMQTWCVHARQPVRLVRDCGLRGALLLQLFLVGNVVSALIQPVALMLFGVGLMAPDLLLPFFGDVSPAVAVFHLLAFAGGYAVTIVVMLEGLRRRRLLTLRSALTLIALMPAYWLMLSAAAWRALAQFFSNRFYWEKTEHGLARTSRLADSAPGGSRKPI